MPFNQAAVKAIRSQRTQVVPVPEWGMSIKVRGVTAMEQEHWWDILDDWRKGVFAPAGKRGSLVMMGCVNEDGSPLFSATDAEFIGSSEFAVIDRLYTAIQDCSGVTPEVQSEIEKKHERPTSSSSTGSATDGGSTT